MGMEIILPHPSDNGHEDAYSGAAADYYDEDHDNLLDRWLPTQDWVLRREQRGLFPYCKSSRGPVGPRGPGSLRDGLQRFGVQFATQDFLSLSSHPAVCEAAHLAIANRGLHSGGSAGQMGLSDGVQQLEDRMAHFVHCREATSFPSGWAAAFGVIRTLVRPKDHVVLDANAQPCLYEAALAATRNVYRFSHLSHMALDRRLERIRANDASTGILVVTESLFALESDSPDLAMIQATCRRHGATLLVDVSHDLGAQGPDGRGVLGLQQMLGKVDVVMGSFARTFASNGGFVASNHSALKLALQFGAGPHCQSTALSPVQAAVISAALDIIESPDGALLRERLARNISRIRRGLAEVGFAVQGTSSPVIPVFLGETERARKMTGAMLNRGVFVNLIESPVVDRNRCRWNLNAMSRHEPSDIEELIAHASEVRSLYPN